MVKLLSDSLKGYVSFFNSYLKRFFSSYLEPKDLYDASKHLLMAGGKRLRPFLVFQACRLVDGDEDAVMPAAVAVELIHNFTLIHDDIMDEDSLRRGVPTVHVLWNVPLAILAGDLLFSKAFETIFQCIGLSVPYSRVLEAARRLASSVSLIAEGQALDMGFEGKLSSVDEKDYLNMIHKKTAVLIKASCEVGALIGGGSSDQVEALSKYGENIGMAFQMRDDILGVVADEKELGKPIGSDVKDAKCTLVLLHAFTHSDYDQRRLLLNYYGKKDLSRDELESVVNLLRDVGSIDYVASLAKRYVNEAKEALGDRFAGGAARRP